MFKNVLLVLLIATCFSGLRSQRSGKPNIIIILTDDQGYQDLGCYGSPDILTPNIDTMAAEGVRLTDYYVAQPVCSASRAAILTGCYPNRIGIHNALMPNAPIGLNPEETTLAEMLKNEGYRTAIFGKWHLGDAAQFMPNQQGFDEYFGIPYSNDMWPNHPQQGTVFNFGPLPLYRNEKIIDTLEDQSELTRQITEMATDFIRRNKEDPFFLYVPHPQPHVPLFASKAFRGKSKRGLYGDVMMEIDWSVGEIIKALNEHGLSDNTLVIYTSDNGPWLAYGDHAGSAFPFREGKGTTWEGGQRVPFIAKFPGYLPQGKTITTPVMGIDILPTIASITGASLPEKKIDGHDITPILKGISHTPSHEAYFNYYRTNELQSVRYGKWKLVFPHAFNSMKGQSPGKDGNPGKYKVIHVQKVELYDLETDKEETIDVAANYPEIVTKIKEIAAAQRALLGDSLMGVKGIENRDPGKTTQ
ncbi:sulfatase family protein [Robertkochia solimangrovi]|uniref:sulfatase family protein n=1 Tax=Robertkochia solimangrovi TaxID=2213046 RepID=UPI00117D963F|nr:sulfatase [Robertkochia solimangrovi]TRZ43102.1 arylsulfatase [Robertkochia solimangrovi]